MHIERLIIANQHTIDFINPYEVLYCQSESRHTNIFLVNGKKIVITKTLIILQREFPSILIRVGQCTIVNKLHIESIDKKTKAITLNNGITFHFTMTLSELLNRIRHESGELKYR